MKWKNVRLILAREIRDQMRDRRTLFMIAVLPILLYPLLGIAFFQVSQFRKDNPARIALIGVDQLPAEPALLVEKPAEGEKEPTGKRLQFNPDFCVSSGAAELMELTVQTDPGEEKIMEISRARIDAGDYDAVVRFPPDFGERLKRFREAIRLRQGPGGDQPPAESLDVPGPQIFANMAKDPSQLAYERVSAIVDRWRQEIIRRSLLAGRIPAEVTRPFNVKLEDVSESQVRRAAIWSRILPFILIIWALTGAFYPAIDLCAGEKERGTLETLLTSPARRSEIVLGKLLTVMAFSMATALLNLLGMTLTGIFIIRQFAASIAAAGGIPPNLAVPPLLSIVWLLLALIPLSALFSALALALAAMARSTKEGQYYLMPLLMVVMPLAILPLLPGNQLDLGSSLIPVTGMMFLLRSLMEGELVQGAIFAVPVLLVTFGCCHLAVRWAVRQFNDERVLFRESERFNLRLWATHLIRDREETPTVAQAFLCAIVLLIIRYFSGIAMPSQITWRWIVQSTLVIQIAFVVTPPLLMAIILTRSPRKTFLLRWPRVSTLLAAPVLALLLHPTATMLSSLITWVYPIHPQVLEQLKTFEQALRQAPNIWCVIGLIALTPAICEELAFRGFILSGLRHLGNKRMAILISSVFFGIAHSILQQSISAVLLGIVIGYLAVQTESLLPCMLFHFVFNATTVLTGLVTPRVIETHPWLGLFFQPVMDSLSEGGCLPTWPVVAVSGALAIVMLLWFYCLPHAETAEETILEKAD